MFEQINKRTGASKIVTAEQKAAIEGSELKNRFLFKPVKDAPKPATAKPVEAIPVNKDKEKS